MEEIKGFFIEDCIPEHGRPIKLIKDGLSKYDSVPDNAVIFWSGNMSTLFIDYRIAWHESGRQVAPIAGTNSMLLKDFMP